MIPYADLKAQYQSIKEEIDAAVLRVLASAQFVLGKEVSAFEEQFAAYCGTKYAVAVNSGTSALHLALLALGIGPGDEVITVPFTFVATVAAIRYTGATPVFVDIDPRSFTIDVAQLERAITKRTKAILPVHLYGQPADMDLLVGIASRYHLPVIEDAAQAHGSEYKGRRAGGMGEMGCFSFYPGKNLGAYGEGGTVVTNSPDHAHTIRMLRDWGQERRYEHVLKGFNYRMDGIQGAILAVKLRHLEKWTEARRANAAAYDELLAGSGVETPRAMPYARHVYHVYAVRAPNRDALQLELEAAGIQTGVHYPTPIHLLKAHEDLGHKRGEYPSAEHAAREVLSLPMFAEMTHGQIEEVAGAVRRFYAPAS